MKVQRLRAALLAWAGLAGAAGVALAAVAAHRIESPALIAASTMLVVHAAAAVATVAVAARPVHLDAFLLAASVLLLGVSLFSGDIAMRTLLGHPLFFMAAPIGGSTMIVGWIVVAAAGVRAMVGQRS